MKIFIILSALILTISSWAGLRYPPSPHVILSPGGDHVFTMVPGPKGKEYAGGKGICYKVMPDGTLKEMWKTSGWYSEDVDLEYNGEVLARMGTWRSGDQDVGDPKESLGLAFYRRGVLTRSYKISDLVKDDSKLNSTTAGLWWLEYVSYSSPWFRPGEGLFQAFTTEGVRYLFDINTGKIVSRKHEPLEAGEALAKPSDISEQRDLSAFFGTHEGAFVLYDAKLGRWLRFNPRLTDERFTPCSTFKIANALISLETGVADGPDFRLKWDGVKRPIEDWNADQTLRSAFRVSCLWFFQEMAKRVGQAQMQKHVRAIGYGNDDTTGDTFWLEGALKISPNEQMNFVRRLHERDLPFSAKAMDTVLDLMILAKRGDVTLRGKTGTAGDAVKHIATLGWFVGGVSAPSGQHYFATLLTKGQNPSGREARKITEAILEDMRLLPKRAANSNPKP